MKLKKHGALLVNFVIDFANGDMSREDFDMDYSGYVIEPSWNLNGSIFTIMRQYWTRPYVRKKPWRPSSPTPVPTSSASLTAAVRYA